MSGYFKPVKDFVKDQAEVCMQWLCCHMSTSPHDEIVGIETACESNMELTGPAVSQEQTELVV